MSAYSRLKSAAVFASTDEPLSGSLSNLLLSIETTKPGKSTTIGTPLISVIAPLTAGVTISLL